MLKFQGLKNLMKLKKSEELLQTGREEHLPDMPGYNLLFRPIFFYYKSIDNYKFFLQKLDDSERKLTFL